MMNDTNRELFKKALSDALSQKYGAEISECGEDTACSQKHYVKMQKIVGGDIYKTKRRFSKKALIAIIIAAALLLTGCAAAYVYRNEIGDFIEEIYDTHIKLTYGGEQNFAGEIQEQYELTYVPSGYEKTSEKVTRVYIFYKYENEDKKALNFRQEPVGGIILGFNAEGGHTTVFICGDTEVYCRIFDTTFHYVWSDGKYIFSIDSYEFLDETEIAKIIENIAVKN